MYFLFFTLFRKTFPPSVLLPPILLSPHTLRGVLLQYMPNDLTAHGIIPPTTRGCSSQEARDHGYENRSDRVSLVVPAI